MVHQMLYHLIQLNSIVEDLFISNNYIDYTFYHK